MIFQTKSIFRWWSSSWNHIYCNSILTLQYCTTSTTLYKAINEAILNLLHSLWCTIEIYILIYSKYLNKSLLIYKTKEQNINNICHIIVTLLEKIRDISNTYSLPMYIPSNTWSYGRFNILYFSLSGAVIISIKSRTVTLQGYFWCVHWQMLLAAILEL